MHNKWLVRAYWKLIVEYDALELIFSGVSFCKHFNNFIQVNCFCIVNMYQRNTSQSFFSHRFRYVSVNLLPVYMNG